MQEDLRLLYGSAGHDSEVPSYLESPTWILDAAWDRHWEVARRALDAYMNFCEVNGYPNSYLLGLDILIMGELDPQDPSHIIDLRPTMVEGPCCNSFPADPTLWASRLYKQMQHIGLNPDSVEYPTNPTAVCDRLGSVFVNLWKSKGHAGMPRLGVFTRAYAESEEEGAHLLVIDHCRQMGMEVHRITPEERPEVKGGRIWVHGVPIDIGYRRIERIHVPVFYGMELGRKIINETPDTLWINPWQVDDWRSKTIEEKAFRMWEQKTGSEVPRPRTLLGSEITPDAVRDMALRGGYVMKRWNSTGGKGVFLHMNLDRAKPVADKLYGRYDGRNMLLLDSAALEKDIKSFASFSEDASIQQLRLIDARPLPGNRRLCYDTRINVVYNAFTKEWEFLSGISRSVPCGLDVSHGNSLLTNITSGAEVAPLITGARKPGVVNEKIMFGPLLEAIMNGKNDVVL